MPNTAPADARTTFGLYTSTDSPQHTMPAQPDASALRSSVPRLPGSDDADRDDHRARPASDAIVGRGGIVATASTGWGVRVEPSFSSTPSFRSKTGTSSTAATSSRSRNADACVRAEEDRVERRAATQRVLDDPRPFEHERRLGGARRRVAQQRAEPLDLAVLRAECDRLVAGHAASSASRAVLTRAPNAVGVAHREVGEDLAVDLDLGGLQPGDEARVADALLAARGVDPDDPQLAEVALARRRSRKA